MWRKLWQRRQVEPSNGDLDRWLNKASGSVMKVSRRLPSAVLLTAAQITRWNSALGKVVSDMEECGPESEQSLTLKHYCVCTLHQDLMRKDLR